MGCATSKQIAGVDSPRTRGTSFHQSAWPNGLTTSFSNAQIVKEMVEQRKRVDEEKKQERLRREKDRYKDQLPFEERSKKHGSELTNAYLEPTLEKGKKGILVMQPDPNPRSSNPVRHIQGEQAAAGWPMWLCNVAGEAISGWIPRRADSFEKLAKIGQGTYSNVYKAKDLHDGRIVALKKVRFDNLEPESVQFMAREILILRRLDHPNIIKLQGLVTSRMSCSLYLIFEYMEHDLAGLAACPGITFTEAQVKCYMQQLLRGLNHCHVRNILHRDIKGSNLLLDNAGNLKIADFGLATTFNAAQKQPMTNRVVTLWYRPPELLLGATEYDTGVDLWSTGCILAELLAGRPILPGRTEVEQLHKIFKLCGSPSEEYWKKSKLPHATIFKPQHPYKRCLSETFKNFPASALNLLERLLAMEPAQRGTAAEALQSNFFTTPPLACEPASLPRYPPSKELDAKLRAEGARRHKTAAEKDSALEANQHEGTKAPSKKEHARLDARTNSEAASQKRRAEAQFDKRGTDRFYPLNGNKSMELPVGMQGPSRYLPSKSHRKLPGSARHQSVFTNSISHSGPLGGPSWKKPKDDDVRMAPSKSIKFGLNSVAALVSNRLRSSGVEGSAIAARHRANGMHRSEKGNTRQQSSSYFAGKDRGVSQWPAPSSKQEKGLKTNVFQKNPERISHSGPLLRPGMGATAAAAAADDIEDLIEEHERKMRRAARRVAKEIGGS